MFTSHTSTKQARFFRAQRGLESDHRDDFPASTGGLYGLKENGLYGLNGFFMATVNAWRCCLCGDDGGPKGGCKGSLEQISLVW